MTHDFLELTAFPISASKLTVEAIPFQGVGIGIALGNPPTFFDGIGTFYTFTRTDVWHMALFPNGEGFESILIHGKNTYVMTIGKRCAKLSVHKKSVALCANQWGCDKPVYRVKAKSGTFGSLIVLFFLDMGKMRSMMVFGKALRSCEILKIWSQHHGIEQFWRSMKSIVKCSKMSLAGCFGAYANLGVKVMGYLMLVGVSVSTGQTFHQIQMELSGQRELFGLIMAHFHHLDTAEYG